MTAIARTLGTTLLALALSSPAAFAEPIFMNFDVDFSGRALAPGTLLNNAYPIDWLRFGADDQVVRTGDGVPSLPNFARGSEFGFGAPIDLNFSRAVNFIQASNVSSSGWTLHAFDALDRLLGTATTETFPGTASLSFPGQILRASFVRSAGAPGGFGIDDLLVDSSPVPEPGSMLLVVSGAAYLFRRRVARSERQAS